MDYAIGQMMGRVTAAPQLFNIGDTDRTSKAVFDIAVNFPTGKRYVGGEKDGQMKYRTLYRRIVCWGPNAEYVSKCNDQDSIVGRLVAVVGRDDDEVYTDPEGNRIRKEVLRADTVTIMDRKRKVNGD